MNASHGGTATDVSSPAEGFFGLPLSFILDVFLIFRVVNGVLAALILAGNAAWPSGLGRWI